MLLSWCVQKDYLSQTHRLFEAPSFKPEGTDVAEIEFYLPTELRAMLDAADVDLLPVIALGGLAGLRREEILRLNWQDVWRVNGKVEIGARIAKGRKRRLVTICPALAAWLQPYHQATGLIWKQGNFALEDGLRAVREVGKLPARRNGLRHAFITFYMAKYVNENLAAAEAGNSPAMIHEHYRGLATEAEAEKWFAIKPVKLGNVIQFKAAQTGASKQ
jgi:integrase